MTPVQRGYCACCGWSETRLKARFVCWWCYEDGWRAERVSVENHKPFQLLGLREPQSPLNGNRQGRAKMRHLEVVGAI